MKHLWYAMTAGLFCVSAAAGEAKPPDLHALMKVVVAPQTQVVWDVGNQALGDDGSVVAAKLKPADWAKLTTAAGAVKDASRKLADAPHVLAAAPNQKIEGEGNPGAFGAKEVQAAIDANPAAFRAFANQLATVMDEVIASAKNHDAAKLTDQSGRLDQVCEQCHQQFWYPNSAQR